MTLLAQASGFFTPELLLAFAAGVVASLLLVQLLRGRSRARRLHDLAAHATLLGAAGPLTAPAAAPHADGSDDVGALARAMAELQQRLAESESDRDRFLARTVDELRRPLALLATSLELALRRRAEVPELTAALRDAHREAERIARLADRTILLRGLATPAGAPARAPVDLAALGRAAVAQREGDAARRGISLRLDAPQPVAVAGDAGLLSTALGELLDNALHAGRHGGQVVVEVRARPEGPGARVRVLDDGPGVPAPDRDRVFEPFNRGVGNRSPAGLGLALVRAVARVHGGDARVEETARGAVIGFEVG